MRSLHRRLSRLELGLQRVSTELEGMRCRPVPDPAILDESVARRLEQLSLREREILRHLLDGQRW